MSMAQTWVFKVSLNPQIWRTLELLEDQTLHDLHLMIQKAFDWDDDHLYAFFLTNKPWDRRGVFGHPAADTRPATRGRLRDLALKRIRQFLYIFDLGDEIRHQITVLERRPVEPSANYPRILEVHGQAPPQYGDPEEEDWIEDDWTDDDDEPDDEDLAEDDATDPAEAAGPVDDRVALDRRLGTLLMRDPPDYLAAAASAEEALAHPDAPVLFDVPHLLVDLAELYELAGRYEEAVTALRRALEAGWEKPPDGRIHLVELLFRAGRSQEADALLREIKAPFLTTRFCMLKPAPTTTGRANLNRPYSG
jgi:tetratricopeptide (TPR) repeat protein